MPDEIDVRFSNSSRISTPSVVDVGSRFSKSIPHGTSDRLVLTVDGMLPAPSIAGSGRALGLEVQIESARAARVLDVVELEDVVAVVGCARVAARQRPLVAEAAGNAQRRCTCSTSSAAAGSLLTSPIVASPISELPLTGVPSAASQRRSGTREAGDHRRHQTGIETGRAVSIGLTARPSLAAQCVGC